MKSLHIWHVTLRSRHGEFIDELPPEDGFVSRVGKRRVVVFYVMPRARHRAFGRRTFSTIPHHTANGYKLVGLQLPPREVAAEGVCVF